MVPDSTGATRQELRTNFDFPISSVDSLVFNISLPIFLSPATSAAHRRSHGLAIRFLECFKSLQQKPYSFLRPPPLFRFSLSIPSLASLFSTPPSGAHRWSHALAIRFWNGRRMTPPIAARHQPQPRNRPSAHFPAARQLYSPAPPPIPFPPRPSSPIFFLFSLPYAPIV